MNPAHCYETDWEDRFAFIPTKVKAKTDGRTYRYVSEPPAHIRSYTPAPTKWIWWRPYQVMRVGLWGADWYFIRREI